MRFKWQNGQFDKQRLNPVLHPFTPAHAVDCLEEVDLEALHARGKRLILLDVDNTLVLWKQENFAPEILAWLAKAKSLGFDLCILSNTRRPERLKRISAILDIPTVRGKFKPSAAMYRLALIKFHCKAEEAIMMGDQMMTDILGANRAGIDAIWVRQMGHHEFGGTKFNRFIEHLLKGAIYASVVAPMDERPAAPEIEAAKPLPQRTIVHQIVRFAMVGGIAFVIDFAIRNLLLHGLRIDGELLSHSVGHALRADFPGLFSYAREDENAAAPFAFAVASLTAMTASFLMNRAWTFEVKGREERMKQARRFYAVSIGGYFINLGISNFAYNHMPATSVGLLLSSMCGAGVAAVWNFLGSRYYAFRS